jgi:hypothetical protein
MLGVLQFRSNQANAFCCFCCFLFVPLRLDPLPQAGLFLLKYCVLTPEMVYSKTIPGSFGVSDAGVATVTILYIQNNNLS